MAKQRPKHMEEDSKEEEDVRNDSKDYEYLFDRSEVSYSSGEDDQPQADKLGPHGSAETVEAFL